VTAGLDLDWTFVEWLTVIGFPLVLLGIAARGAQTAAVAAQTAVERTERRLADNHLLLLIPQLGLYRRELDLAVDGPDRRETLRLLGEWPTLASELQGILERIDRETHKKLIRDLARSTTLTGKAKDAIIARREELEPATRAARSLVHAVSAESSKIVGTMKAYVEDPSK
jgi:hypothetical protein